MTQSYSFDKVLLYEMPMDEESVWKQRFIIDIKGTRDRRTTAAPERKQICKMRKKGTRNPIVTRNESSASNESSETIATSTSQNQDVQISDGADEPAYRNPEAMELTMHGNNQPKGAGNPNNPRFPKSKSSGNRTNPAMVGHELAEGQKMLETLPQKPSLSNKLWKMVAFSTFVNLQEFMQKSLMDSAKDMNDDTALEMSEGGAIYIKKRKRTMGFENISEWLLVFKAYMNTVLIIYENRKQELNSCKDHINELCIRYEFIAVIKYDKERSVSLVMDRDSTLIDRSIEAEGKCMLTIQENLKSVNIEPTALTDYIEIEKKGNNLKTYRVISHLSAPAGASINDGIDVIDFATKYKNINHAVRWITQYGKGNAEQELKQFLRILEVINISYKLSKLKGPSTALTFLRIYIDTVNFSASILEAKKKKILEIVAEWNSKEWFYKKEMQSLVGSLTIKVSDKNIEGNEGRLAVVDENPGVYLLEDRTWLQPDTKNLFTDASNLGGGATYELDTHLRTSMEPKVVDNVDG
ncbi:hypothetical protein C2G38_2152619 [Gigaspora rosea]|uniref:Uncharacterized protein n=1 Tax=Gigaspora rosea TaxID=44941 RepID=A0A397WAA2_9GLOM|nr:hypothetical protein C2G38_2152619 [Gigaspora rosea]